MVLLSQVRHALSSDEVFSPGKTPKGQFDLLAFYNNIVAFLNSREEGIPEFKDKLLEYWNQYGYFPLLIISILIFSSKQTHLSLG